MNANWCQRNWGLLLAGVLFVAALGTLLWMEHDARQRRGEVRTELQSQFDRLDALHVVEPYPSPENILTITNDFGRLANLQRKLNDRLANSVVTPPDVKTGIDFAQLARETIQRLNNQTREANVVIADDFKFGFTRYATDVPCRLPLATGDDCAALLVRLGKQLRVVEHLTTLLISNGVDRIGAIQRTEVEPGSSADSLNAPIRNDDLARCTTYPFALKFDSTADALQGFLNSLGKSEWLFAVRNLTVTVGQGDTTGALLPGQRGLLTVEMRVDLLEFNIPRSRGPQPKPPRS